MTEYGAVKKPGRCECCGKYAGCPTEECLHASPSEINSNYSAGAVCGAVFGKDVPEATKHKLGRRI